MVESKRDADCSRLLGLELVRYPLCAHQKWDADCSRLLGLEFELETLIVAAHSTEVWRSLLFVQQLLLFVRQLLTLVAKDLQSSLEVGSPNLVNTVANHRNGTEILVWAAGELDCVLDTLHTES